LDGVAPGIGVLFDPVQSVIFPGDGAAIVGNGKQVAAFIVGIGYRAARVGGGVETARGVIGVGDVLAAAVGYLFQQVPGVVGQGYGVSRRGSFARQPAGQVELEYGLIVVRVGQGVTAKICRPSALVPVSTCPAAL